MLNSYWISLMVIYFSMFVFDKFPVYKLVCKTHKIIEEFQDSMKMNSIFKQKILL